ncbi:hypothetical protein ANO11243_089050 [Dothideomycetidae sp. 11243]|nr:hypothetical protein ANO11243_089050 [fungal sp. No.11243]
MRAEAQRAGGRCAMRRASEHASGRCGCDIPAHTYATARASFLTGERSERSGGRWGWGLGAEGAADELEPELEPELKPEPERWPQVQPEKSEPAQGPKSKQSKNRFESEGEKSKSWREEGD